MLSIFEREVKKIEFFAEQEAKQQLLNALDQNLLAQAKELCAEGSINIIGVYCVQGLAEVHCYLKTVHQFEPAEVEALLQFADPLQAAYLCWEENSHKYSFPICDLLEETQAKDRLPLAEVKPLKKPSLRQQLNTALKEARQHPPKDDKTHGGDVR